MSQMRLGGPKEIAAEAGVSPAAPQKWRQRYPDYPQPVQTIGGRALHDLDEVARWVKAHNLGR